METTIMKKKGTVSGGRRKIEMKKIEKKSSLLVTFSKRRKGLFKKAAEFSLLSGANIAIIVQSPAGKIFATGGQAPIHSIIDRYLAGTSSNSSNYGADQIQQEVVVGQKGDDEKKFLEIVEEIEEEKEKEKSSEESMCGNAKGFWWDNLNLNELKELKQNVENKIQEMAAMEEFVAADHNEKNLLPNDEPCMWNFLANDEPFLCDLNPNPKDQQYIQDDEWLMNCIN